MAELLSMDDGRHCTEPSALTAHELEDARGLCRIEHVLAQRVVQCQRSRELMRCPLIAALFTGAPVVRT